MSAARDAHLRRPATGGQADGRCVGPACHLHVTRAPLLEDLLCRYLSNFAEQGRVFVSCAIDGAIIRSISTS